MVYSMSVFAVPISSFQTPVPPPAPSAGGCDLIAWQFDPKWLPYIMGAMQQLLLQTTWQGTDDEIGVIQGEVNALLASLQIAPCVSAETAGQGLCGDDDMACCFRVQDNKLQQFCCGEWTTILDLSGLSTGQPGPQPDSPQPGGGQASTCYTLSGPGSGFLPWQVSAGDVLLLSDETGAVNDGSEIHWRGPSGREFILNNYIPFTDITNGTDRLVTAPHDSVIITFDAGATWYSLVNPNAAGEPQPFTVPPGVDHVQPVIQINVPLSTIVGGSYGFCVKVTNNAATTWEHTFDFAASQNGWVPFSPVFSGTPGSWVSGSGWNNADYRQTNIHYTRGMQISSPNPTMAGTIKRVRMYFDMTRGSYGFGTSDCELYFQINGTQYACIQESVLVSGSGQILDTGTITETHTNMDFFMWSSDEPSASYSGACRLSKIVVDGEGTDPWL